MLDGLMFDGLMLDGLMFDGLMLDGLTADGLIAEGLDAEGLTDEELELSRLFPVTCDKSVSPSFAPVSIESTPVTQIATGATI